MIWLAIAVGVAVIAVIAAIIVGVRRSPDDPDVSDVDPLFTTGIAVTGAGVALATTVGPLMYAMMIVALITMAIGVRRTRRHGHDRPRRTGPTC